MQAGKLTESIQVQSLIEGRDPIGQPIQEWAPYFNAWAEVLFLTGKETIQAGAETATLRGSVRIRRRPGRKVKPDMRMIYQDEIYNIIAVMPNHRKAYLDLLVESTGESA